MALELGSLFFSLFVVLGVETRVENFNVLHFNDLTVGMISIEMKFGGDVI